MNHLDTFFSPELVTSSRDLCEPKPGVEFTAKAVLVEEDEEEVEELKEPSAMSAPPSDTHITTNYEEAVEEPEDVQTLISPLVEVEELEEPQSESEEEPEEQPAAESEELQANVDHLEPEEPRHVVPITDDEVEEDLPESQGDENRDVMGRNAECVYGWDVIDMFLVLCVQSHV